jgi:hypothetical protein
MERRVLIYHPIYVNNEERRRRRKTMTTNREKLAEAANAILSVEMKIREVQRDEGWRDPNPYLQTFLGYLASEAAMLKRDVVNLMESREDEFQPRKASLELKG